MSPSQNTPDDPWLTLAEIADELRVNPATVRAWVSKGQLKASRAGLRKWIVRRSDLDRMLSESGLTADEILARLDSDAARADTPPPAAPSDPDPVQDKPPKTPSTQRPGRPNNAVELLRLALQAHGHALEDSAFAPPSPGYVDRIRAVADAHEHLAATTTNAADTAGMTWKPQTEAPYELPYELKPSGNRPGPHEMWEQFDAAFDRHVLTTFGTDIRAVADSHREVYEALRDVADRLEADAEWRTWERQAR